MRNLYPDITPYRTHQINVDEPHVLYVEESGNPEGIPVIFIHGGPGAGCEAYHRRFFDPNVYRIILFDQRGSVSDLLGSETGATSRGIMS